MRDYLKYELIQEESKWETNLEEVIDYLYTMVEEMASNDTHHDTKEIIAGVGMRCEWAFTS